MRAVVLFLLSGLVACNTLQSSAANDPMKCERDPACRHKKSGRFDCNSQCADDPVCVDRCREIEVSSGTSGR